MNTTFYNCRYLRTDFTSLGIRYDYVTNMYNAFTYTYNLLGSAICGPNVTNIYWANCGNSVNNLALTYSSCGNLRNVACGPNVDTMYSAYSSCRNLTCSPVCGPNVNNMF
jgi:hypothetical protein